MDTFENNGIIEETANRAGEAAEEIKEEIADAAQETAEAAEETAEQVTEAAEEQAETVIEETAESAEEAAEEAAGEAFREMVENAKEINETEQNAEDAVKEKKSPFTIFFDIISIVSLATIIVGLAFIFCFRTVGVEGSSMYPTLHDKDRIILSAFVIEPKQGDIVVTCQPSAFSYIESTLVKRVIATEGQSVDIDFDQGIVYVDGEALDEPYVNELTHDRESFAPLTVPEDYVFVMGDNRNASTDSRDYRVGLIREDYIMGKALFRIAPFGQFKIG
jgi:signal peptidase I